MRVLVTGGAGYTGSVVVEELVRDGHTVVVLDNLSTGHPEAVAPNIPLVRADLRDRACVEATLRDHQVEAVVHMAADALVGESVQKPGENHDSDITAGLSLLDAMVTVGVSRLVFSSTAAVYGEPARQPIEEHDPTVPTTPYGETKLAFERALRRYDGAHGLRSVSLRCFNAAGASERCGELHDPETHLIPVVLQAAAGLRDRVNIFGGDYKTPDGTCIRDYIHVSDLARAHVLALGGLERGSATYNLGCGGKGYSVLQVIDAAWRVTGEGIPVKMGPRRAGDPAVLVASSDRIQRELGWSPTLGSLDAIVESAWKWMQRHPHGYPPRS